MNAIPATLPVHVQSPLNPMRFAPQTASARRARPALRRQFVRLVQFRQSWGSGLDGISRPSSEARVEREVDWAEFDAPTFLRRGIVIEGLPDWRGSSPAP